MPPSCVEMIGDSGGVNPPLRCPGGRKAYRNMSFLVTGGTGFIGSNVVRCLLRHGERVVCFDRSPDREVTCRSGIYSVRRPNYNFNAGGIFCRP